MAEVDLFGVFVSGVLPAAAIAFAGLFVLQAVMRLTGFYNHVWHRSLVDVALFTILWCLATWAMMRYTGGFA